MKNWILAMAMVGLVVVMVIGFTQGAFGFGIPAPKLVRPGSAGEAQIAIPSLSAEERTMTENIVLSDARVKELILNRGWKLADMGVITADLKKVGACVLISFDEATEIEYDWLLTPESTVRHKALVREFQVDVDFSKGQVVSITPMP